jgi:hypothetical protein
MSFWRIWGAAAAAAVSPRSKNTFHRISDPGAQIMRPWFVSAANLLIDSTFRSCYSETKYTRLAALYHLCKQLHSSRAVEGFGPMKPRQPPERREGAKSGREFSAR